MMIWRYKRAGADGWKWAIGVPVSVVLAGRLQQVVYQFGDGTQDHAVVDLRTGHKIADIGTSDLRDCPQNTARAAVARVTGHIDPAKVEAVLAKPPTLNHVPQIVGRFA